MLFHTSPDFVWALIASMFVGNIILLIMNLPMVPLFALSLRISYSILYPIIILICVIGVYSLNSNAFDVWVMLLFGVAGYFMKKYDISGAPLIIGLVLGPIMEKNLYRALALGQGKISVFVTRPISAVLLGIALVMTIVVCFKTVKIMRTQIGEEES
jgi:TctA family transporter